MGRREGGKEGREGLYLRRLLHCGPAVLALLQLLIRGEGASVHITSSPSSSLLVVPAEAGVTVEALPKLAAWREGGREGGRKGK